MVTEAELLAAVARAPREYGPRLVYADWLLERSDPRGELILLEHQEHSSRGGIQERAALERLLELAARHGFVRLPHDPDADVLSFTGGGSHPTQYELDHSDGRAYYLRWRYGFSVDVDGETVLETDLELTANDWTREETNVILAIVSDAIRSGVDAIRQLVFPTADGFRAHPRYRVGRHPALAIPDALRRRRGSALDGCAIAARDEERWFALWRRLERIP